MNLEQVSPWGTGGTKFFWRSLIVVAARRVYGQIGAQKTTVDDIARELRTSPADIYRFFASKVEIDVAVRDGPPEDEPEDPEPITPPEGRPPVHPGSAGAARPLPEQDRVLSLEVITPRKAMA